MSWEQVNEEKPTTTRQRRALYVWGIPIRLVKALNFEQASTMLGIIIDALGTDELSPNTETSETSEAPENVKDKQDSCAKRRRA